MKLRKLLPIVFLAVAGLSACNGGDTNKYDVNITNLGAIIEEWHVGDASRTLTVSATKNGEAVNPTQLLNKEIFVTSSNQDVLSTLGFVLTPVSAGETTVKVAYHDVRVEVELSIKPVRTCIDKYGTVHAGTEADPLDYADANKIGAQMKTAGTSTSEENIYIEGVVKSWYHFPGERAGNDEATSWFIEGDVEDTSFFEIYKCVKSDGKSLTDEDVWIGAKVLVYGQIGYYNSQLETTKATFVKVTGGEARPEVNVIETGVNTKDTGALAVGKKLSDGDTTWDKYKITGYTVNFLGTNKDGTFNYMIADSKTEADTSKMFEIYGCKEELKFQEKVLVESRIKNYHGTIETNLLTAVTVLEEGTDWVEYKEPDVKKATLAEAFADESGNYKQAFEVTGTISNWDWKKSDDHEQGRKDDATKYGNFFLKEEGSDTEYYIYGATASASALSWGKYANKYAFANPQDFLTDSLTKGAKIGSVVTMKVVRCDYRNSKTDEVTLEATGVVLAIGAPADYTAAYAGGTTTNMTEGENNAVIIGLDAAKFDVRSEKGGASNHVGLNKDGTIRLYSVAEANGNILTITSSVGNIDRIYIKIKAQDSAGKTNEQYLKLYVANANEATALGEDGSYEIGAASFKLVNEAKIKSTQIWIESISIWMADAE